MVVRQRSVSLSSARTPTKPLIELALSQRELNLGTAFGGARMAGADVTRFECYSAPFHVELDDGLREVLAGTWDERDPRY
jgi:hypothetical protein